MAQTESGCFAVPREDGRAVQTVSDPSERTENGAVRILSVNNQSSPLEKKKK